MSIDPRSLMVSLAEMSGEIIRRHFSQPLSSIELKADATPVTEADRLSEQLMRERIRREFPEHAIFGEEFGWERQGAEWTWVLDPIDGTKSFIAGTPQFGTLIALLQHGRPVLGAIHSPMTRQLLIGDGEETTLDGIPTRVRGPRPLSDCTLLTTGLRAPARHQDGTAWEALVGTVAHLYTWGDCHGYHLLCCGGADIMCDPVMSPWDLLALIPVVRGAGGIITDWQGRDPVTGTSIVASTPSIHSEVIAILNRAPPLVSVGGALPRSTDGCSGRGTPTL